MTSANVKDFGAKGDGQKNDLPAFRAALASLAPSMPGYSLDQAGVLEIPPGVYRLLGTWNIDRRVAISGSGGGGYGATALCFPPDSAGIRFQVAGESENGSTSAGSRLEGVNLFGGGGTGSGAHGVWSSVTVAIDHCLIEGFRGNGIYIYGDSGASPSTNTNGWRVDACVIKNCHGNGFEVGGADGSAGCMTGTTIFQNGGAGVFDHSFTGNYYFGILVETSGGPCYRTYGASNRANFFGCYGENGLPNLADAGSNPHFFGGIHSNGFQDSDSGTGNTFPVARYLGIDGNTALSMLCRMATDSGPVNGRVVLGGPVANGGFAQFNFPGDDAGLGTYLTSFMPWRGAGYAEQGKNQWLQFVNNPDVFASGHALQNATVPAFGVWPARRVNGGTAAFGHFLLGGFNGHMGGFRKFGVTTDPADASNGLFMEDRPSHVGDVFFHSNPTPGGIVGWSCVDGGSRGTYSGGCTATANGSNVVVLSSPSDGRLTIGDRLTINGVTAYVVNMNANSPTSLTMSACIPSGSDLAISYYPPTWKAFGRLDT